MERKCSITSLRAGFFRKFLLAAAASLGASSALGAVLLQDAFSKPDGLITNEYAYWNPGLPESVLSPVWEMTSGSLFASSAAGWTGVPDDRAPNAASSNGTNSAVFRLTTKRSDFGDVAVTVSVLNRGLSASPSTPAADWDGLHLWLRYQSEEHLYYASINRRDNNVVIKKKIPGGPSNGGTYYNLSSYLPHSVPYNAWQHVKATVQNNADGSVTIKLYAEDVLLVSATDNGTIGGAPIRAAGKVGLRGDNANLSFDDFTVADLAGASPPPPVVRPAAPANVKIAAADSQLAISWDPVPGAASYVLYRSRFPGVNKTNGYRIPSVTSPKVNDGFVNGVAYYMVVTAVNAAGESVESAQVSGIPGVQPPPPAPKNVRAVAGNSQVTVSWDPVPGATSYVLYRSRFPGVNKTNGYRIPSVTSPKVNDGFVNGVAYYMVVTAVNAAGESVESAQVSATPRTYSPPRAPINVRAVAGNSQVTLSWDPVPGATSYVLYRSRFPGVNKTTGYRIPNVASPKVNTGFINGVPYYMVVTAVNTAGESIESLQVSATPQAPAAFTTDDPQAAATLVAPNPWRADRNPGAPIVFGRLAEGATVDIFTPSGERVAALHSEGPSVRWNLLDEAGRSVASGLYIYRVTDGAGRRDQGVFAVIR